MESCAARSSLWRTDPSGILLQLVYGILGNRRIPLPACAYTAIRQQFPVSTQEERFHFGVFSEKLKLTKSSVPSLITFNCDIKFPKGFLSL